MDILLDGPWKTPHFDRCVQYKKKKVMMTTQPKQTLQQSTTG